MLSFGLGLNCAINFPGRPDKIVRPVWDLLVTRTGVTIASRPAAPTFSVTNVSADGATIMNKAFRPIWDLLATRTGVTIAGRPAAPTFSITNVSADGATIKRG